MKRVLVKMRVDGYICWMVKEFYLHSGGYDEEEEIRNLRERAKELGGGIKPDAIIVYEPGTDRTVMVEVCL